MNTEHLKKTKNFNRQWSTLSSRKSWILFLPI
ncbi:MAG TPA: hypothetical protein DHV30_12220 [Balneola sp.]|nr:hypothetical protein [Balneola sp.]